MKYHDLIPIQKPHTNQILNGRPAKEGEDGVIDGKVHGLPVTLNQQRIVSVWQCRSLWWRLRFLFHGEITLTTLGQKQPAVAISVGDTLK